MWRYVAGIRGHDITMVTWCRDSGDRLQKSQLLSACAQVVAGRASDGGLRSGNLSGSRMKNTGVLLPTRS